MNQIRFLVTLLFAIFLLAPGGRAQEVAPSYGLPKALAAWCSSQRAAHHFSSTSQEDSARAVRLAAEAIRPKQGRRGRRPRAGGPAPQSGPTRGFSLASHVQ